VITDLPPAGENFRPPLQLQGSQPPSHQKVKDICYQLIKRSRRRSWLLQSLTSNEMKD
jgi:hypothetical protein